MTGRDVFRNTVIVRATLAGAYVMLLSVRIIITLLFAIIIASAIRPLIARLTRWRIPEGVALVLIYLGIGSLIFTMLAAVLPPVIDQFSDYIQNEDRLATRIISTQSWLQANLQRVLRTPVILANADDIRSTISNLVNNLERAMPTLVDDLGATLGDAILVFVMGVYWLTSLPKAITFITQLFRVRERERVQTVILNIEGMMGSYVRGVIFVAFFVGVANFILLSLLSVPNAATLAFIIGLGTMLPVIGGFLGGGLATFLALLSSPINGLAVLVVFVLVQQVETHYLTPRMMSRSIGVDPLLIIVAVFVGFTLAGVTGAVLAVPILGTSVLLLRELVIEPRKVSVSGYKVEDGVILLEGEPKPPDDTPSVIMTK